jgi:hypothetical protein
MPKRKVGNQIGNLTPDHSKSGIASISLRANGMRHIVKKLLTKDTTLLQTSFQLGYGPPKLQESQLWEFQDSHLGVLGQNGIWVLVLWPGTKYIIKGEGGGFSQFWAVVNLVNSLLLMARPNTTSGLVMH